MLREKLKNYKVILASGSPRRQQFFKDLDIDFEIRLKEIDEIYPPNLIQEDITDYLGGFQYLKSPTANLTLPTLQFFPTAEGYVNFDAGVYKYVYNYLNSFLIEFLLSLLILLLLLLHF